MSKPTILEDVDEAAGGANWLTPEGQRPKGRRTTLRVMLILDETTDAYLHDTAKAKKLSPQRLVQKAVEKVLQQQQLSVLLDDNDK